MIIKKSGHTLELTAGVLKIIDHNTDGVLMIQHVMSQEFQERLPEDATNPLVDLANKINEDLDNNTLALRFCGNNNFIELHDNEVIILEGSIELIDVYLRNVYLENVSLVDVELKLADTTIMNSDISDLKSDIDGEVDIRYCFIRDQVKIALSPARRYWKFNTALVQQLNAAR